MNTNDLITILGTNVERVERRSVARIVFFFILGGIAIAIAAMLLVLGIRPDLNAAGAAPFLAGKLIFAMAVVVLAAISLTVHSRPGGEHKSPIILAALPFIVITVLAILTLLSAPRSHWERLIVGDQWLECLLSIPIIAIVPFALIAGAVRSMAPTNLVRAGTLAGLLAGSISAVAYSLHCTDDSIPFVAVWYGGTIALCTMAGAALGPRLLRW